MVWGRPQPETDKDNTIAGWVDGAWKTLVSETRNYQRLRVHRLNGPPAVDRLRITVQATQGIDHARICEVRVYE